MLRSLVKKAACAATALCVLTGVSVAEESGTPAMWRAADKDTEIFLLGTFHLLPPEAKWRTEAMEKAFESADVVYFEADVDSPEAQQAVTQIVMTQGFNTGGATLTSMLEEEDAEALKKIAASVNLPLAGVDPMRPWLANLTLAVQFIVGLGFDPNSGVDTVLAADATSAGKEVRYFETATEQIGFFTDMSPEVEKKFLLLTIREWDEQVESFDDLFDAWFSGDVKSIDKEMNVVMGEQAPEVYETLLVNRNKNWAVEIDRLMDEEEGVFFIAVGAGHLVGDDSVQSFTKKKGIRFSRYGKK